MRGEPAPPDTIVIPGDLTRNIGGHILKHSIRPKPCSTPLAEDHYNISSKLSVHHLGKVVLMPLHFSATGWGCLHLDPVELAAAFELPDYLSWDPTFATSLVPIQILHSVMDGVLNASAPASRPSSRSAPQRDATSMKVLNNRGDGEWLTTINRWLPGSWAETEIADKAVKSDDAEVNIPPGISASPSSFPVQGSLL